MFFFGRKAWSAATMNCCRKLFHLSLKQIRGNYSTECSAPTPQIVCRKFYGNNFGGKSEMKIFCSSEATINNARRIKVNFLKQILARDQFEKHWSKDVKYINIYETRFTFSYYFLKYSPEWLQKGRIVWYCLFVQIFNLPDIPRPSNLQDPVLFSPKSKTPESIYHICTFCWKRYSGLAG